jgi:hypothetical protein
MLSRTFVCCLALACAGTIGCGSDDDDQGVRTERFHRSELSRPSESGTLDQSACPLFRPREVARIVGRPGVALRPRANDSTDLSVCGWRGTGLVVQLIVDGAPRAQLRYFNQLAEQLEFHNTERGRKPQQLKHVGDDAAYGGAGAWWTPSKGQLVAYAKGRILRVRVVGAGFGDRAKRRACARLARASFRRLSSPGP